MRVAIVGGGISGLALAERLAEFGAEPLVLERAPRVGGRIATLEKDGFLLETGPNGFLDSAPKTIELAERIGLGPRLRRAGPESKRRWIYVRGALRQVPSGPRDFFSSDVLPLSAKLRMAFEPFSRRAREPDESIASFRRRHLGARATRDVLGAMVVGIHAGDVGKLSLPACFPRMAAIEREHRSLVLAMMKRGRGGAPPGTLTNLEGGMAALVRGLASRLGDAVRTGVRVDSIRREEGGLSLSVTDAQGRHEIRADAVVVTTPAGRRRDSSSPSSRRWRGSPARSPTPPWRWSTSPGPGRRSRILWTASASSSRRTRAEASSALSSSRPSSPGRRHPGPPSSPSWSGVRWRPRRHDCPTT